MARDLVTVVQPVRDASNSVATATITKTAISAANGATIVGATGVKDNSLTIVVETTLGGTVTIKAGAYHNAVLGDLAVPVEASTSYAIKIENPSRFQKADGNIDIDFTSVTGYIYAVGKHAGLEAS